MKSEVFYNTKPVDKWTLPQSVGIKLLRNLGGQLSKDVKAQNFNSSVSWHMPSTICRRVDLQLRTQVLSHKRPPCSVYHTEKAAGSFKCPSSLCTNIPLSHSIFLLKIVSITTEIRGMNRQESINKVWKQ